MKQPLNALIVKEGEGTQEALPLGGGIFTSKGISNSYLVTTRDANVLINTGMYNEAAEIQRRFAQVSTDPVRVIVITQGHADHVGGWSQFDAPGIETIVQANHADVREILAKTPALLHSSNGKTVEPRHHKRRSVLPAAGTGDYDDVLRQPLVHPRRPHLRAVLDAGRRDDRLAGGVVT